MNLKQHKRHIYSLPKRLTSELTYTSTETGLMKKDIPYKRKQNKVKVLRRILDKIDILKNV